MILYKIIVIDCVHERSSLTCFYFHSLYPHTVPITDAMECISISFNTHAPKYMGSNITLTEGMGLERRGLEERGGGLQLEEREGELEESEGGIGGEMRGWVERGGIGGSITITASLYIGICLLHCTYILEPHLLLRMASLWVCLLQES